MEEKISIAPCNGMSHLGLIGRVACSNLATDEDKIISICITSIAASKKKYADIITKYPIIAVNGCSSNCVNKILKSENVNIEKTIDISSLFSENDLKDCDCAKLGEFGVKAVEKLKIVIKELLLINS